MVELSADNDLCYPYSLITLGSTKDKPVQNDAPVLPRQFQYEPGFFS